MQATRRVLLLSVGLSTCVLLAASCEKAASERTASPAGYAKESRTAWAGAELEEQAPPELRIAADDTPPALRVACDDQTPTQLFLSPDDSNSMSSPAQIRDRVLGGNGFIGDVAIRPWEFMNYYSWDYPAAAPHELALSTALALTPGADPAHPRWTLQLAVSSEAMAVDERPPMNVTLVLDTSGSMGGESIELLESTSEAIAGSLRVGDTVSVVEWDTSNTWSLANHAVTGPDDHQLLRTLAGISANGGTDLHGGLSSGYELATRTWDAQAINRLVLISDGGANVGVTDIDLIAEHATLGGQSGIYLVGVGVGDSRSYHDQLMDQVTDAGKGASVFIGSEADAEQMFGQRFLEIMGVAARDVRVELKLPPGFEIVRFSGEEYSSVAEDIEPQHLAPNDTMIFHQELETCAPELVSDTAEIGVVVSWRDRDSFEARELTRTYSFGELLERRVRAARDRQLDKGAAIFAYARALQQLTGTGGERDGLSEARAAVDAARGVLPNDADLAEIDRIMAALGF